MKTKALILVSYFLDGNDSPEDKAFMTEDGLFLVNSATRAGRYDLFINDCGWRYLGEIASLRCARVWIKNFYRTMTIKKVNNARVGGLLSWYDKSRKMVVCGRIVSIARDIAAVRLHSQFGSRLVYSNISKGVL